MSVCLDEEDATTSLRLFKKIILLGKITFSSFWKESRPALFHSLFYTYFDLGLFCCLLLLLIMQSSKNSSSSIEMHGRYAPIVVQVQC